MKKQITSPNLARPNGHFSQATTVEVSGRFIFISGMTARQADGGIAGVGDVAAQTRQVCENLRDAAEAAGCSLADVVRVDVYVRNMEHFATIQQVRADYFSAPLPASTMVEVSKLASPDYLIEINAIAVVPETSSTPEGARP